MLETNNLCFTHITSYKQFIQFCLPNTLKTINTTPTVNSQQLPQPQPNSKPKSFLSI